MPDILQRHAAGIVFCLLLTASPVCAQSAEDLQSGGAAYYTFARPGQNTIRVVVLGGGQTGIYEVGENIDLAKLVALSQGVGGGQSETTVRLFRPENGKRTLLFEAEMEKFVASSDYPALKTGDIVRIETVQRRKFGWREVLRLVTTASSLIFAFDRLFN